MWSKESDRGWERRSNKRKKRIYKQKIYWLYTITHPTCWMSPVVRNAIVKLWSTIMQERSKKYTVEKKSSYWFGSENNVSHSRQCISNHCPPFCKNLLIFLLDFYLMFLFCLCHLYVFFFFFFQAFCFTSLISYYFIRYYLLFAFYFTSFYFYFLNIHLALICFDFSGYLQKWTAIVTVIVLDMLTWPHKVTWLTKFPVPAKKMHNACCSIWFLFQWNQWDDNIVILNKNTFAC